MTNEQRVKSVYPEAVQVATGFIGTPRFAIYSRGRDKPGAIRLSQYQPRVSWAWAEAARKVAAKKAEAKTTP